MLDSFNWFLKLRWGALAGQTCLLVIGLFYYELSLPWKAMALLLATIPLTDLTCRYLRNHRQLSEKQLISSLLLFDTFILSCVLYYSGGPTNPFSIVYLLHVVLAAVILDAYWTWTLVAITTLCFGSLFFYHQPVTQWSHATHDSHSSLGLHLQGMFFAYVLIASTVAIFLTRMIQSLNSHNKRLQKLQGNQQRLASMTALATNTAHELGTPLSTIAVISHELELSLQGLHPLQVDEIAKDVRTLKQEAMRCRTIINNLCSSSGMTSGETSSWIPISELLNKAYQADCEQLKVNLECGTIEIKTSPNAVATALRSLIKNAIQASQVLNYNAPIKVAARYQNNQLTVEVTDKAGGLPEEVYQKIGTPFISTKPPGEGMGLGIYVAKLIAEQLHGTLNFLAAEGGTTVTFSIPVEVRNSIKKAA